MTDSPIDAYLADLPADQREALERVRAELHRLVPDAEESMGYGMPVIKHLGQGVLWFAGWKKHLSIYPLTDSFLAAHEAALEGYERTEGEPPFHARRPAAERALRGAGQGSPRRPGGRNGLTRSAPAVRYLHRPLRGRTESAPDGERTSPTGDRSGVY